MSVYLLYQVVLSHDGQLELAPADHWSFHSGRTLELADSMTTPFITAAIIGRDYSRDP